MNAYPKGSLVVLAWKYTNIRIGNVPYDPDNPKLTVRTPLGVLTTYTYPTDTQVVKDATGVYHLDLDAANAGEYTYRSWATGTGQASSENQSFEVTETI